MPLEVGFAQIRQNLFVFVRCAHAQFAQAWLAKNLSSESAFWTGLLYTALTAGPTTHGNWTAGHNGGKGHTTRYFTLTEATFLLISGSCDTSGPLKQW